MTRSDAVGLRRSGRNSYKRLGGLAVALGLGARFETWEEEGWQESEVDEVKLLPRVVIKSRRRWSWRGVQACLLGREGTARGCCMAEERGRVEGKSWAMQPRGRNHGRPGKNRG